MPGAGFYYLRFIYTVARTFRLVSETDGRWVQTRQSTVRESPTGYLLLLTIQNDKIMRTGDGLSIRTVLYVRAVIALT